MALPPTHKYWVKPAPCLDPDAAEVQRFQSEVAMYERLGLHPRILRYHGRHHTPPGILLDSHQKGNLGNYLHQYNGTIPLLTRLQWAVDIAEGLAHIHSKGAV